MNAAPSPDESESPRKGRGALASLGPMSPARLINAAAWIVFGPITGLLSHHAGRAMGEGRRWAAAGYVALNVAILLSLPLATVLLGHRFGHPR